MKNYPRHRAQCIKHIMKDSYEEIIKSAKRKYKNIEEFYIFKIDYFGDISFEEGSVDIYNNAFEHWKKINGKWQKV